MRQNQYVIHILFNPGPRCCAELITLATQRPQPASWRPTGKLWAEQSVRGGDGVSGLCDLCIHRRCMRSCTRAKEDIEEIGHMHTFHEGEVVHGERLSPQTDEAVKQRDRGWVLVVLELLLYRHAPVIIEWASGQRGCFFVKQPLPPCQASPRGENPAPGNTPLHAKSIYNRQSQIKHFFCSFIHCYLYLNVKWNNHTGRVCCLLVNGLSLGVNSKQPLCQDSLA